MTLEISEDEHREEQGSASPLRNGTHVYPSSSCAKISLPVFLRTPSRDQVTIAYFPMGTSEVHPHDRISSVSRNDVDGRVRCEVKDSVIHGREETAEGIPIDYQMIWESSPASIDTFRKDYYMFKKNGELFLTPAQVVHMRTIIEPKGSRQETKGFLSQSAHQGSSHHHSNHSSPAGKWINFKNDEGSLEDIFNVDEKRLQRTSLSGDHQVVDLEGVLKVALSLQGGPPTDLATNPAVLLSSAKTAAAASELSAVFKAGRIQRMSSVMKLLPGKSPESILDALKTCAFLVQGNWVGRGRMFFEDRPGAAGFPLRLCFDYLLSFFARSAVVDVSIPNMKLKLKTTTLNGVLNMFARHTGTTNWKLQHEPDSEFIRAHPDLVKAQEKAWDDYRIVLEKNFEQSVKLLVLTPPSAKDANAVPGDTGDPQISTSSVSQHETNFTQNITGKRKAPFHVDSVANKKTSRGGRGRGRGR